MLSNPILENKYKCLAYAGICLLLSATYSLAFGLPQNESYRFILYDAVCYGVSIIGMSFLLWNVWTYSILKDENYYRNLLYFVLGVIASICIVALETGGCYFLFPYRLEAFYYSIPQRFLVTILLYWVYLLHYSHSTQSADAAESEELEEEKTIEETTCTYIDRITARTGSKITIIPVNEIVYLKAEDDYVSIVTDKGHWLKEQTMKSFEAQLSPDTFIRLHRSYIININKISKIERYGQQQQVQLFNGEVIRISVRGYKLLKDRLNL
ncbi:MAG: LytTR family DNA-binding domain-containing protein [Bacteroidaceae bacterium]